MGQTSRRPLDTPASVETFISNTLRMTLNDSDINKIVAAEIQIDTLEKKPTLTHEDYRDRKYRTESARECLREKILQQLLYKSRIDNDDNIRLGRGGARPKDEPKAEHIAIIVSGAPASGKSGIATSLADYYSAYILDSDYAKRKFPEYRKYSSGASLVHREADQIVFGPRQSLSAFCFYNGYNVVIPLVGRTRASLNEILKQLKMFGYLVHLVTISLDRVECTRRAYNRFIQSQRYVPLSYVFDEVGNEPERIFWDTILAQRNHRQYASFTLLSTAISKGKPPIIRFSTEGSPYTKGGIL